MGQYFIIANFDKKEYIRSDAGAKLSEWFYTGVHSIKVFMQKMATSWQGDRVFAIGDYAVFEDMARLNVMPDDELAILQSLEREFSVNTDKEALYNYSLYAVVREQFKLVDIAEKLRDEEQKYNVLSGKASDDR